MTERSHTKRFRMCIYARNKTICSHLSWLHILAQDETQIAHRNKLSAVSFAGLNLPLRLWIKQMRLNKNVYDNKARIFCLLSSSVSWLIFHSCACGFNKESAVSQHNNSRLVWHSPFPVQETLSLLKSTEIQISFLRTFILLFYYDIQVEQSESCRQVRALLSRFSPILKGSSGPALPQSHFDMFCFKFNPWVRLFV